MTVDLESWTNTGTLGRVKKRVRLSVLLHPSHIDSTQDDMAPWSAEDHTPSPNYDMGSVMYDDDSDDHDPSPYSIDESGPLWKETSLIHSRHISDGRGSNVYLEMKVKQRRSSPR